MNQYNRYKNIIDLPHHKSRKRIPMPVSERAAQFAPFAALKGHSETINETARRTTGRIELDEQMKAEINQMLLFLKDSPNEEILLKITYFIPDLYKEGGSYETRYGVFRGIRENERLFIIDDKKIEIDEIIKLEFFKIK